MLPIRIESLARDITIPAEGFARKTIFKDQSLTVLAFGFAPNAVLPDHSVPSTAAVHILEGEMQFTLGEDEMTLPPGSLLLIPPQLNHSARAGTAAKMLVVIPRAAE